MDILHTITTLDWEEMMMMICAGFAGLAYVVADIKRERILDGIAMDLVDRIAKLELAVINHDELVARMDVLDRRMFEMEPAVRYGERIARLEGRDYCGDDGEGSDG